MNKFDTNIPDEHNRISNPKIYRYDFLTHYAIKKNIEFTINKVKRNKKKISLDIIDIGAGDKPYQYLFQNFAKKYIGVDINATADIVAQGEKLPIANNSFDLAICFQMLEHSKDPQKVISEIKRIIRKGGYVILSAPGVWPYHPCPIDYYRWTHEGLRNIFKNFSSVEITLTTKSYATIIQLINIQIYDLSCKTRILKPPLCLLTIILNIIGKLLIDKGSDSLSINYCALAIK